MKLRYYLRGLGIGMIVTAFLMGIALDGQNLSDTEIKARAAALGMVEKDSRTLSEIQASNEPEGSSADMAGSTAEPDTAAQPTAEPTTKPDATAGPTTKPNTTAGPTTKPNTTAGPTTKPNTAAGPTTKPNTAAEPTTKPDAAAGPTAKPDGTPESGPAESITFVIHSGQSSNAVSKALAEAGLVEDAAAFDQYLVDNGYSRRVRAGTYEIPLGSTEEEIAKKIAGSR